MPNVGFLGMSGKGAVVAGVVAVSAAALLSVGTVIAVVFYKHSMAGVDVAQKVALRREQIGKLSPITAAVTPTVELDEQPDGTFHRVVRDSAGEIIARLQLLPGQKDHLDPGSTTGPSITNTGGGSGSLTSPAVVPVGPPGGGSDGLGGPPPEDDPIPIRPSVVRTKEPLTADVIAFSTRVFATDKLKLPADCAVFREAAKYPLHEAFQFNGRLNHLLMIKDDILAVCDAMAAESFDPAAAIDPTATPKIKLTDPVSLAIVHCKREGAIDAQCINKFMETHELSDNANLSPQVEILGCMTDVIQQYKGKGEEVPDTRQGVESSEWDD